MVREIEAIYWSIGQMPMQMVVSFVAALIGMSMMVYAIFISPLIFNYFLIPGIEKKIGRKLIPHPLLRYIALGKWMCHQDEIAVYVINRYCAYKFKGDKGLPKYCNRFDLKKAGYTIDMASRSEIFFSFVSLFSIVVVIISAVVAFVANTQFKFY